MVKPHEPCHSRSECYHQKAGRITALTFLKNNPNLSEWARKGGIISGRANVRNGHIKLLASLPRSQKQCEFLNKLHIYGGRAAGLINGPKAAAASRHRKGPNRPEAEVRRLLDARGISYKPEVVLGVGMGVADVLVGQVVGELDGRGHWVNWRARHGVSDIQNVMEALIKDARHDMRRAEHGLVVVRDSHPERLVQKIEAALGKV